MILLRIKNFFGTTEKRIYRWIFYEKIKLVSQGLLVFFSFINFFMKVFINQELNLLTDCAYGPCICCEKCMPDLSVFVLNLRKSGSILFRSMLNGNCLLSSASYLGA